jgi:hypothetical protein
VIDTDAKENVKRIEDEKNKRLESNLEKVEHINPSGEASGENFEAQKNSVIAELQEVIEKLRRMQGNSNQTLEVDKKFLKARTT